MGNLPVKEPQMLSGLPEQLSAGESFLLAARRKARASSPDAMESSVFMQLFFLFSWLSRSFQGRTFLQLANQDTLAYPESLPARLFALPVMVGYGALTCYVCSSALPL